MQVTIFNSFQIQFFVMKLRCMNNIKLHFAPLHYQAMFCIWSVSETLITMFSSCQYICYCCLNIMGWFRAPQGSLLFVCFQTCMSFRLWKSMWEKVIIGLCGSRLQNQVQRYELAQPWGVTIFAIIVFSYADWLCQLISLQQFWCAVAMFQPLKQLVDVQLPEQHLDIWSIWVPKKQRHAFGIR